MKLTKERMEYVLEKWADTPVQDIAKELGVTITTVYKWTYQFKAAGGVLPERTIKTGPKNKKRRSV